MNTLNHRNGLNRMNGMLKSLAILAATCGVSLVSPGMALAQTSGGSSASEGVPNPARVVERTVRTVRDIAFRTNQDLERIAYRGVERIGIMKRNNAPSADIIAEGVKITNRLAERATGGKGRIDEAEAKGLAGVTAGGGTSEQSARITDASNNTEGRINSKLTNATARVNEAVAKATETTPTT